MDQECGLQFCEGELSCRAKSILSSVREVKGMDESAARKVDFYTRQFVDALSCVCRKLKPERSGDEVRPRGRLNL
jgi:hypothetical protein